MPRPRPRPPLLQPLRAALRIRPRSPTHPPSPCPPPDPLRQDRRPDTARPPGGLAPRRDRAVAAVGPAADGQVGSVSASRVLAVTAAACRRRVSFTQRSAWWWER